MLLVTSQRWKLLLLAESCMTKVSPILIRDKNTSMSTLPVVKWLMFSCVEAVCEPEFHKISPDPGSPEVAPVSVK
jgi:hypothetical protein